MQCRQVTESPSHLVTKSPGHQVIRSKNSLQPGLRSNLQEISRRSEIISARFSIPIPMTMPTPSNSQAEAGRRLAVIAPAHRKALKEVDENRRASKVVENFT